MVAQRISTDSGPPVWAVDKRAELGWPSSRGKGGPPSVIVAHVYIALRNNSQYSNEKVLFFQTFSRHALGGQASIE